MGKAQLNATSSAQLCIELKGDRAALREMHCLINVRSRIYKRQVLIPPSRASGLSPSQVIHLSAHTRPVELNFDRYRKQHGRPKCTENMQESSRFVFGSVRKLQARIYVQLSSWKIRGSISDDKSCYLCTNFALSFPSSLFP
jgi:hypothetical protein